MSLARRASALVVALLVLQLGLARRDLSCTTPADAPTEAPAAPAHHDDMPMSGHHDGQGSAPPRTEAPVCCQALASCATFAATEGRVIAAVRSTAILRIEAHTDDVPVSPLFAPDPPPPKA